MVSGRKRFLSGETSVNSVPTPKGLVLSIDRFAGEDGPGIRTTVFFKGCPLRCTWCHSPESISLKPQLFFTASRCIACGACVTACPRDAQVVSATERRVLWENCDNCGDCIPVCPSTALEMSGQWMTAEQVLATVLKDKVYYDNSGGGVTFCGGEPTMQPDFLSACLKACHDEGIHTAVDTCGQVKWPVLAEMLPCIDLFLFDIKQMDSARHRELTGVGNELILDNLQKITAAGKPVWIRIPLIPGCNDSEDNLARIAELVAPMETVERITLLPYNVVTGARYPAIGEEYRLAGIAAHTREEVKAIAGMMSAHGKKVETG